MQNFKLGNVLAFILCGALLSACADGSGTNPFKGDADAGTTGGTTTNSTSDDKADPDTDEVFLINEETGLVGNRFEFVDGATDAEKEIIINNLPFDGVDPTRYLFINSTAILSTDANIAGDSNYADVRKVYVFENEENLTADGTPNPAQDTYYALAISTDSMEAATVATAEYRDEGYGGAVIRRKITDVTLPSDGIYVYRGVYAGQRTFNETGGLELVQGDVEMNLDMSDFDITGATRGSIFNRVRKGLDGSTGLALPTITLSVTDDGVDGVIETGEASTTFEGDARDTGTFTALIGGSDGTEMAGMVNMTGVAEIQRVNYNIATLTNGTTIPLSDVQRQNIITALENGVTPPFYDTSDGFDPTVVASVETTSEVFQTDYNARETGVFITKETDRTLAD